MTRIWLILERSDSGEYTLVDVAFRRSEIKEKMELISTVTPETATLSPDNSVKFEQLDVSLNDEGEVVDDKGRFEELNVEPFNNQVIEYLKGLGRTGGVKFF